VIVWPFQELVKDFERRQRLQKAVRMVGIFPLWPLKGWQASSFSGKYEK